LSAGLCRYSLLFAEFFFFDEFKSRFNPVAVDYLYVLPKEVFSSISGNRTTWA